MQNVMLGAREVLYLHCVVLQALHAARAGVHPEWQDIRDFYHSQDRMEHLNRVIAWKDRFDLSVLDLDHTNLKRLSRPKFTWLELTFAPAFDRIRARQESFRFSELQLQFIVSVLVRFRDTLESAVKPADIIEIRTMLYQIRDIVFRIGGPLPEIVRKIESPNRNPAEEAYSIDEIMSMVFD